MSKKIKVFHSMPLRGLTDEQIQNNRKIEHAAIIPIVAEHFNVDESQIEILATLFDVNPEVGDYKTIPLWYFGKGLMEEMSKADVVTLGAGWEAARGCTSEAFIAQQYGIPVLTVEPDYTKSHVLNLEWTCKNIPQTTSV
jgi:hypothetical protein